MYKLVILFSVLLLVSCSPFKNTKSYILEDKLAGIGGDKFEVYADTNIQLKDFKQCDLECKKEIKFFYDVIDSELKQEGENASHDITQLKNTKKLLENFKNEKVLFYSKKEYLKDATIPYKILFKVYDEKDKIIYIFYYKI